MSALLGTHQTALLAWLVDDWLDAGPPVGLVEGFAGTGKSQVARELVVRSRALGWRALLVLAPESKSTTAEDLALDLAQKMSELGDDAMVAALDAGHDLWEVLAARLAEQQTLVVVDEAQQMMRDETGRVPPEVAQFIRRIASAHCRGRVLF